MKGAFVLAEDPHLFSGAKDLLVSRGGLYVAEAGVVQIGEPRYSVFTLYDSAEPEWEFRTGPFAIRPGVIMPDMSEIFCFAVECNSEQFFTEIVQDIASTTDGPTWVLDGDGVLWKANEVDPAGLRL